MQGPPEIAGLGQDVERCANASSSSWLRSRPCATACEEAQQRLEAQADELQRSNRDLEQFAYVASHDLQEPLRKVASFCQLLERRYTGQLDERADQYIAFAVDGAKRMQQLINDLLAFSRVGRRTTGRSEVSLGRLPATARCATSTTRASRRPGRRSTADPLPTVWGEKALLTALLQNLIGNAIKFRGDRPARRAADRRGAVGDDEYGSSAAATTASASSPSTPSGSS